MSVRCVKKQCDCHGPDKDSTFLRSNDRDNNLILFESAHTRYSHRSIWTHSLEFDLSMSGYAFPHYVYPSPYPHMQEKQQQQHGHYSSSKPATDEDETAQQLYYLRPPSRSPLRSVTALRALIIGLFLSLVHVCGVLLSVYLLVTRVLEPDMPEKSMNHVCTTAIFCPMYRVAEGLTGIAIQLAGSGELS